MFVVTVLRNSIIYSDFLM